MSQSATPTQREFVAEEFETSVTEETTTRLAQKIEEIVRSLRRAIDNDDLINDLLHNPSRVLREANSVERSDPEPLTQQVLVEPLCDALNYPTFSPEAGDLSDQCGQFPTGVGPACCWQEDAHGWAVSHWWLLLVRR